MWICFNNLQVFAETMEFSRDEEQEEILFETIRDADAGTDGDGDGDGEDIASQFLNDSGEGMEGEDDGSGARQSPARYIN